MNKLLVALGVSALLVATFTYPSQATDQSTAVDLCNKAPKCAIHFGPGGVSLYGQNSAGHYEIYCADEGECECVACPSPSRLAEPLQLRGTVVGGATASGDKPVALTGSIVETVLKWKLKGKKKVVDTPMEGPTPNPQGSGQPAGEGSVLSGQGSDGGTGSGHIGNGNGVRLGVFQAM